MVCESFVKLPLYVFFLKVAVHVRVIGSTLKVWYSMHVLPLIVVTWLLVVSHSPLNGKGV